MTSLGLMAYMLSMVLRVDGVVLCFGQDGHVELEIAAPDMTCGIPAADKEGIRAVLVAPQGMLDTGHCGSCRDIPLMLKGVYETAGVHSFAISAQDETVQKQLFVATHLSAHLLPILETPLAEVAQSRPEQHFPLASLRTVILLI